MTEYVSHPLIKERCIERRAYQISVAATALMHNTLLILPTGLGKTVVAAFVIASRLHNVGGKILLLAPTKPLVEQHAEFLRKTLNIDAERIISLSGEVSPEKRSELWDSATIIISTPQVIENDLISGRINLQDVVHMTFDEAHRAVGNYAYVFIAKKYFEQSKNPLILAMTASPGSNPERIQEVVENLGIEDIEIRTELDEDVKPYIHEKDVEWVKVEMPPEFEEIRQMFLNALKLRFNKLKKLGITNMDVENASKRELLAIQEALQGEAYETKDSRYFDAVSILAEIMKIMHGIELIETQGLDALKQYLKRLMMEARSKGSRAAKKLVDDVVFRNAVFKASSCKAEHPKLKKLREIIQSQMENNPDSRIIIFTNYRDTAEMLSNEINKIEDIRASKFIGQASRINEKGMRQRKQVEILNRFREGEINVLISTSVGEEGLDIPSTDLVIFYEAVPSEIRAIQRRGRTGRAKKGKIVVLVTKGTRDEGYYWSSFRKERLMYAQLYELRDTLLKKHKYQQTNLENFIKTSLYIYADSREAKSGVVKKLHEMGIGIKTKNLDVADYVISDRVAIERKTVNDFIESLIKKDKLFTQLFRMKKTYQKPILIIEGDNLYRRAIHPNAVRGALAAIAIDFAIPVLFTATPDETAEMISAIAVREQKVKQRDVALHSDKSKKTLKEQQEYVVASISNIGPVIAKNLLEYFKTIEKIATADEKELIKVPKVGKKTAENIRRLMTTPYDTI